MTQLGRYCLAFWGALFLTLHASAGDETVVLRSDNRDKITLKYNVAERDGRFVIRFLRVTKDLSSVFREKYHNLDEVRVFVFDKTGGFGDGVEFVSDNVSTRAFNVTDDRINYQRSAKGYMILDDPYEKPEMIIEPLADEEVSISVPLYLAHYEKRKKYKILSKLDNLNILLPKRRQKSLAFNGSAKSNRSITVREEVEAAGELELSTAEIAHNLIRLIKVELDKPEITGTLDEYVQTLRQQAPQITDASLSREVMYVLSQYENKKKVMADQDHVGQSIAVQEGVRQQQRDEAERDVEFVSDLLSKKELSEGDASELQSTAQNLRRQSYQVGKYDQELAARMRSTADECDKKVTEIEQSKKRRNIWMIVGGVLLAVLMFVGNQVFQHIRTEKSRKQWANGMVNRAEGELTRRAQGAVRSKVNRVQGEMRQRGRDIVRDGVNSAVKGVKGKNNKGFSI